MDSDDIVPSILPELPSSKLTITYPNDLSVDFGNELTPQNVKEAPEISWETKPDEYYTLLMIDPDAPSRRYPILSEVCHWLVGNVKGCDLSTGELISEYRGSGPPPRTGLHRYIFVVFEHEHPVTFGRKMTGRVQRLRFSTKKWREKLKLEKVLTWNYFKAQAAAEPSQETRTCVCM